MFERCGKDERVSIHELSKALGRRPCLLRPDATRKLARYVVSVAAKSGPVDNLAEASLDSIVGAVGKLLGEMEQGRVAEEQLGKKITANLARNLARAEQSTIGMEEWEQLCSEAKLQREETEYLALVACREAGARSVEKIPANVLSKLLEKLRPRATPSGKDQEQQKEEPEEEEEKEKEKEKKQPDQDEAAEAEAEEKKEEEPFDAGVLEGLNEEQVIETTQKCFLRIANRMFKQKLAVSALYHDVAFSKAIDGENAELITPADFLNGLVKLGLNDLNDVEKACLVKVLAINDEETLIKLKDLMQILADFGIKEKESEEPGENGAEEDMNFEELDKVSMVLMLALTEYIMKAKVPLYELFGEAIYQQEVQMDSDHMVVDLINSGDFFSVLGKIGINSEEKEHDNLKAFLCIDPEYTDKLVVRKVKKAIEEFATNEELRTYAQQCYQELVEEEQDDGEQKPKAEGNGNDAGKNE